ncbi:MAG: D-aminoacylase [Lachnospiraceae bacterium]|nr:D-aminoacylase [Lachnospiraceae bacterium]
MQYDLVIKNGNILDGTGNPHYLADVAIQNGKIAKIAKDIKGGKQIIDATGLTVTPGFIDSHSHADNAVLDYPDLIEKVEQGITTSIGGQCGTSVAPFIEKNVVSCRATMGAFLDTMKYVPIGSNLAMLIGHGSLRKAVIGTENRAPTFPELHKMKKLLEDGLNHGAFGMSLGLFYAPGCYAELPELIELAKVVAKHHGIVAAHIRNENSKLIPAVKEFITIIRESGARGVLSHHKVTKEENWGKVSHSLHLIDEANRNGCEIYCDVYPYNASSTRLSSAFIHKNYLSLGKEGIIRALSDPNERRTITKHAIERHGEDLNWVMVTNCKSHPEFEGKRIPEIAELWNKSQYDALFDLVIDTNLMCDGCFFTIREDDIEAVLAHPRTMICTDASVAKNLNVYHPRLRGSFPRVLGRYVRERQITSLPKMIRKMTSLPATVYGLKKKGLLLEGFDADICIFDADKIIDQATFTDCKAKAKDLNYVLINGHIVAKDAEYTGVKAGQFLRTTE